ncbi:MAG: hypothetical protein II458_02775 [Oscillospiraceae bacterium]|nr:hypothetical protein [Oscillospiraceae bacterium]
MKKKNTLFLLLITAVLILSACAGHVPGPKLILNGKRLNVYTAHYNVTEKCAEIPLTAFLKSIGAEYADSPANAYGTQCYSFMGKHYIVVGELHLFMLEEDYWAFLDELEAEEKTLSQKTAAGHGLLPGKNPEGQMELWVDHVSLMNALKKSGVDITIISNYSTQTITVTLPEQDGQ